MKINTYLKTLFILTLLGLGCTKSQKDISADQSAKNSSDQLRQLTERGAEIHNPGLDFVKKIFLAKQENNRINLVNPGNGNGDPTPVTPGEVVIVNTQNYFSTLLSTQQIYRLPGRNLTARLDELIASPSEALVRHQYSSGIDSATAKSVLTPREQTMVAQVTTIFNNAYSQNLSREATYTYLKTQLTALKNTYSSIVYVGNEGELFNGLIDIALQSNEYWRYAEPSAGTIVSSTNNILTNGLATNRVALPNPAFIQMDAAGYILGWAKAVYDDVNAGTLTKDRQWIRINSGFLAAVGFSSSTPYFKTLHN